MGLILIIAAALMAFLVFLIRLMLIKGSNDMELYLSEIKSTDEMLPEIDGNRYFLLLRNGGVATRTQLNEMLARNNIKYKATSFAWSFFKVASIIVSTLLFVLWIILLISNSGDNEVNMIFFGVFLLIVNTLGAFFSIATEIKRRMTIANSYLTTL